MGDFKFICIAVICGVLTGMFIRTVIYILQDVVAELCVLKNDENEEKPDLYLHLTKPDDILKGHKTYVLVKLKRLKVNEEQITKDISQK